MALFGDKRDLGHVKIEARLRRASARREGVASLGVPLAGRAEANGRHAGRTNEQRSIKGVHPCVRV
jgi:hypothetical protein